MNSTLEDTRQIQLTTEQPKMKPRVRIAFDDEVDVLEKSVTYEEKQDDKKNDKKKKKFTGFSTSAFKSSSSSLSAPSAKFTETTDVSDNSERNNYVDDTEDSNVLVFSYPYGKKRQYISSQNFLFTSTPMRPAIFSDNAKFRQRQLEERVAKQDVMDLFSNGERKVEDTHESEEEKINTAISDSLTKLISCEVIMKKDRTSSARSVLPDVFFTYLYDMFQYLNSEERGKIIVHVIFGGLITRSKLTGVGAKSGVSKFADLISNINKLVHGPSNSTESKLYTQIKDAILSSNLNKYRSDCSASDQVNNVTTLIRKLAAAKITIHFPSTITVSDPFPLKDSSGKVLPTKTISISGTPVILNLNTFFEKPGETQTAKPSSSKKKVFDDEDENDGDYEDRMSSRGGKRW